jgi:hypothetical protein
LASAGLIDHHGFHAIGEHAFGHAGKIAEAMHHAGQQARRMRALHDKFLRLAERS